MCYLSIPIKKTKLSKYQVFLPYVNGLLYPTDALEPNQFYGSGLILQHTDQSFALLFTHCVQTNQFAGYLRIFFSGS